MSTHHAQDPAGTRDEDATVRHVRLQVELVLEITDASLLAAAALDRLAADPAVPQAERGHAREAVQRDEAEALAHLVDPFDLVAAVPGVELVQASWSSAHTDYDPADEEWDLYDDAVGGEDDEGGLPPAR